MYISFPSQVYTVHTILCTCGSVYVALVIIGYSIAQQDYKPIFKYEQYINYALSTCVGTSIISFWRYASESHMARQRASAQRHPLWDYQTLHTSFQIQSSCKSMDVFDMFEIDYISQLTCIQATDDDPYHMTLHKIWTKLLEKDWRTVVKSLYLLHSISRDCSSEACEEFSQAIKSVH